MKDKLLNIYSKSPVWIQNMVCTFKGRIEKKSRLGGDFNKIYSDLLKSEYFDKEKIELYQYEKTKEILEYCNDNIPYYRELFEKINFDIKDFKSLKDLEKIPVLTKEIVRNNFKKLKNPNFEGKVVHSHTSGSTGKSLQFIFTVSAIQYRWALWFRHKKRFGIKPEDSYATFTGLPAVPLNQKKPPYWRENRAMKQTIFTMHHISNNTVESIVKRLNKGGFKYYSGYPSILFSLANLIDENNLEITNSPKVIFTGAEALLKYQRDKISEVFGCLVTDQYGFSEGCGNASRCEEDLFHEDFEYGVLECYDPKKNEDGSTTGTILATGFTNLAMPFIRYQVGDTATWVDLDCSCGRKSKTIKEINGRNEDFVITPEGNKILRFDYIFKDTLSISESQIVQKELGSIVIKIVERKGNNRSDVEKLLRKEIKNKISRGLKVSFEYVSEIERSNTGKFRAVKSLIK
ncbi:phenylacetate--CoA ligase family protein [Tenacibaculum sp. SDUM215027]|uniref:phenylacetate--CoA ligase family protein n=1 Tax=Tenacibaculum sp. SDUM215027 TaxID=3422596 RepID=UPI003D323D15